MKKSWEEKHKNIHHVPQIHIFGIQNEQFTISVLVKIIVKFLKSKNCIFSNKEQEALQMQSIKSSKKERSTSDKTMALNALTRKIKRISSHKAEESSSKTIILVDLHHIYEMKKKTISHILKLTKFRRKVMPECKDGVGKRCLKIAGKSASTNITNIDFQFIDEGILFDECIKIQKIFQTSIEGLLEEFILDNFQKFSILLEETLNNMKRAISIHRLKNSRTYLSYNYSSKMIDDPPNLSLSRVKDCKETLDINRRIVKRV